MAPSSWLPRPVVVIGLIAAVIGVIDGFVIAFESRTDDSCGGSLSSFGPCVDYPNQSEGVALIVVSVMLGCLIFLVSALFQQRPRDRVDDTTTP